MYEIKFGLFNLPNLLQFRMKIYRTKYIFVFVEFFYENKFFKVIMRVNDGFRNDKVKSRRNEGKKEEKINDYDTADDNTKTVDVLLVMTES